MNEVKLGHPIRAVLDNDAEVALDRVQLSYHHTEGPVIGLSLGSSLPIGRCPPLTELVKGRRVIIIYTDWYRGPGSELGRLELDNSPGPFQGEYIKQLEDGRVIHVRDSLKDPSKWEMHWDHGLQDLDCPWRRPQ